MFEPIGVWESPGRGSGWEVDRELVHEAVAGAFLRSTSSGSTPTWRCGSPTSTAGRRSTAKHLRVKASNTSAVGWDMRSRLQVATRGTERLVAAIRDGQVRHSGDVVLRRHVLNARRRPNRYGLSFGKESRESPNKVDAFAAAQLADMARHDLLETGWTHKQRTNQAAFF
jgi:hypothetical protein